MPIEIGIPLIEKCIEKEKEKRIYLEWLVQLPSQAYLELNDRIPYNEYLDNRTGKNIVTKSSAEIMAEAEEIRKRFENGY